MVIAVDEACRTRVSERVSSSFVLFGLGLVRIGHVLQIVASYIGASIEVAVGRLVGSGRARLALRLVVRAGLVEVDVVAARVLAELTRVHDINYQESGSNNK